ncbi:MAG TPA: HAMP domain-containing sensor histidine kinase [Dehalococcoidia bacterium]|nr:HAMP domain-containing sensor histidine kinase [Dehalococcoidia bacterium]
MSLQVRLTLVFLLLAAPVLCAFGAAVYLLSREVLYDGLDRGLVTRAETVQAAIQRTEGPLTRSDIENSRRSLDRLALDGSVFQLRDEAFRIVYSSNGVFSDRGVSEAPARRRYTSVDSGEGRLRVLTMPLVSIGELIGYAETTTSLGYVDSALRDIVRVLIGGGVLVLVATALPAYLLAGSALDPVRRVSHLAREIEKTADFGRRLGESRTSGEMQELTDTFNKMIERVEKMMLAQRAFLADSSHELRRPLTLLRTNIDVINDSGLTDADRRLVESEMRAEAESMSRLVANLALLSREGQVAFAFKPTNLTQTCHVAVEQARLAFPQHQFICDAEQAAWAMADEDRFSQVLANLLQNAAAYTPDRGIVLLVLRCLNDRLEIEVTDYGAGMTEADVAHAFDRFYRGSSARERKTDGYGLGLAIVRHVVEAHGGSVSIASRLGEGTRVVVSLPASGPSLVDGAGNRGGASAT